MNTRFKQHGLTLIELMISITLSLIVLAGVVSVFVTTITGSREMLDQVRLNQEMNAMMSFISNDIRRAGYWGDEVMDADYTVGNRNPFTEGVNLLSVSGAGDSCILYSYNLDNDGVDDDDALDARVGICSSCSLPASGTLSNSSRYDGDGLEMFGFKLSSGAIWSYVGNDGDSEFTCDTGRWLEYSDSETVLITNLDFAVSTGEISAVSVGVNTVVIESWTVDIDMAGRLVNDADINKQLSTTVKLANPVVRDP